MARLRSQLRKAAEFPLLDANGLYAAPTKGDGNCLFNALSDQLYGHQKEHLTLRDATIEHMRVNAEVYRQYMTINTSGRRNPKRKVAALAPICTLEGDDYSDEELQKQFDMHLEKMGQAGEWADNMEVVAFASALDVHVRLWQADYCYTFSPRDDAIRTTTLAHLSIDDKEFVDRRPILNIAYHTWEHYSSVRNINGPHSGLPEVTGDIKLSTTKKRFSEERDDDDVDFRPTKRRSPMPAAFISDSNSSPECSEASSDESHMPAISSQATTESFDVPAPERPKLKLVLKLRNPKPSSAPTSPVMVTSPVATSAGA
ncbi:cysteine proteinase [Polyplosphaeria fusca]|uniref:Cysteine proteinase n=1 Tax=Polyplosphaeria fusca TaxID=682080 RepID=A0A9P4V5R0_9PLEO|nr:cysteine proteinase [Polyplosphaeria fusca]